jgi:DNA helicase-2/ATP-dependent DNA helicase PcrA
MRVPRNPWTDGLNPEQQEAALHKDGPLLILAGAGSGKTTTLVSRTGLLIDDGRVKSGEMVVLTFTNKAARELKHRVARRLGAKAEGLWAGTFHSFGLSLLRAYHREAGLEKYFGIIDSSDASAIVKEILSELKNSAKETFDAEILLSMIGRWRESKQQKARTQDEYEIVTEWLLPKYLKKLEHLGVVDFDSLILKPL